jgi:hypothetical protein
MLCERDLVTINIIVHPRRLAGTGAADRQQHSLTRFCEGGVSFKPKISIAAKCVRQHDDSTFISGPFLILLTAR